jgi:hypothetical protein
MSFSPPVTLHPTSSDMPQHPPLPYCQILSPPIMKPGPIFHYLCLFQSFSEQGACGVDVDVLIRTELSSRPQPSSRCCTSSFVCRGVHQHFLVLPAVRVNLKWAPGAVQTARNRLICIWSLSSSISDTPGALVVCVLVLHVKVRLVNLMEKRFVHAQTTPCCSALSVHTGGLNACHLARKHDALAKGW